VDAWSDNKRRVFQGWLHPLIWVTVLGSVSIGALLWSDPDAFANTLDICDELFADFHIHYLPMARALPETGQPVAGFLYPPLLGLGLVPLSWLPEAAAVWVWAIFQLGSIALLIGAVAHMFGSRRPLERAAIVLATLWSVPVLHNVAWGQVSTFMSGLVILSLVVPMAVSAVLLALAVALKLYPLLFVPLRAAERPSLRWLGLWAGATGLLLVGVPALAMGFEQMASFYGWVRGLHAAAAPAIVGDPNSQFIPHVAGRWLELPRGADLPVLWLIASRAIGVAVIFFFSGLARLGRTPRWVSIVGALTSIAFLVPTSWAHYFAHLAPCFVGLALYGHQENDPRVLRHAIRWMGWSGALAVSLPVQRALGGWKAYAESGVLAVANVYLLLAVLIVAAAAAFRPQQPE
jgi:hypothetical protein